jgi:hypothetical protein
MMKRLLMTLVRPVSRKLKRNRDAVLEWLRDYFSQPVVVYSEALAGQIRLLHEHMNIMNGRMMQLREELHKLTRETQDLMHDSHASRMELARETDRVLMALVRGREPDSFLPSLPVCAGPNRILAAHPVVPFQYLDTRDVRLTPRLILGLQEEPLLPVFDRFLRPGACVVEIGAGQGYHTLALAARVRPVRVLAYEPDPMRFAVLHDNLLAHDLLLGQVELRQQAVRSRQDVDVFDNGVTPALVRVAAPSAVPAVLDAWARSGGNESALLLRWAGDVGVLDRLEELRLEPWCVGPGGSLIPTERRALSEKGAGVDVLVGRALPGLGQS